MAEGSVAERDRLVGVKDLEARYGPPPSWWYTAAESGRIPSYKIGKYLRFKEGEIAAWIEAQRQGPSEILDRAGRRVSVCT